MSGDLDAVTPDDGMPNPPARGRAGLSIRSKLTRDAWDTCL